MGAKPWSRVMRIQVGMEQQERCYLFLVPQVCARLTWHTWYVLPAGSQQAKGNHSLES